MICRIRGVRSRPISRKRRGLLDEAQRLTRVAAMLFLDEAEGVCESVRGLLGGPPSR